MIKKRIFRWYWRAAVWWDIWWFQRTLRWVRCDHLRCEGVTFRSIVRIGCKPSERSSPQWKASALNPWTLHLIKKKKLHLSWSPFDLSRPPRSWKVLVASQHCCSPFWFPTLPWSWSIYLTSQTNASKPNMSENILQQIHIGQLQRQDLALSPSPPCFSRPTLSSGALLCSAPLCSACTALLWSPNRFLRARARTRPPLDSSDTSCLESSVDRNNFAMSSASSYHFSSARPYFSIAM